MDDLLSPQNIFGSPNDQPQQNPYAGSQPYTGAQLGPNGPTTTPDPSAYAYGDPRFYTDLRANLNNQGPAVRQQPIPPGSGAGVFQAPSPFATGYYVRVQNRSDRAVRVAQGYITPQGALAFQAPCSVDETRLLHYDQAVAGCKYPLLVELPSKALYLRGLVMPSAPTQITTYLPFESELRDSNTPTAQVNGFTLYADSPVELRFLAQYVAGMLTGSAPQPQQMRGSVQPEVPQQPQQPHQPQQTQTQPQPQPQTQQAPAASSPFASALMLIGGVIAARYLQELE